MEGVFRIFVTLLVQTNLVINVQWLYGKCIRKGQIGNANAYQDRSYSTLPRDGQFRVWFKSDPATTGVFDWRSVDYIVNSEEGKKHYHFFKNMLLGSEEHYFISLLANWHVTKGAVHQFTSMAVWNTWSLGSLSPRVHKARPAGAKSPHTSFLSEAELPVLRGLSRNGVFFARKFSASYPLLLDLIDEAILHNKSHPAAELILTPKQGKISKAILRRRRSGKKVVNSHFRPKQETMRSA